MCGIAGIFSTDPIPADALRSAAQRMGDAIEHRGPDAAGVWTDPSNRLAFSHRRLSIIDLSPLAHQPMHGRHGNWTIVFNGEIYNFRELRKSLEPDYSFASSSDTEVIIALLELHGLNETLNRLRGMFAFAAWHRESRKLMIARDRIGEKPLYITVDRGKLLFASELKAIRAASMLSLPIDNSSVYKLLQFGYIPDPHSIYSNTIKLPAGSFLEIEIGSLDRLCTKEDLLGACKRYWRLDDIAARGSDTLFGSTEEAISRIAGTLRDAIAEQLVADVPVGAFLSGGIDSSLVCALAQEVSGSALKTFSIGFTDEQYDESDYAKQVSKLLGTSHQEHFVSMEDLLDVVPILSSVYDEPFADSSQIPMLLVSKIAREQVTVCLSGDGGDELFGGYNRYRLTPPLYRRVQSLPAILSQPLFSLSRSKAAKSMANRVSAMLAPVLPSVPNRLGDRLEKIRIVAEADSEFGAFVDLSKYWSDPPLAMPGPRPSQQPLRGPDDRSFLFQALLFDQLQYLPGDNLVKVDRASMANSLEVRVPLLDHRLIEQSWRCAENDKIRGQSTKWMLRQILAEYIPRSLIDRPKMGFSVPVSEWLRGDLKDWASDLLSAEKLAQHGIFNDSVVTGFWSDHVTSTRDCAQQLWPVLMFQQWYDAHSR